MIIMRKLLRIIRRLVLTDDVYDPTKVVSQTIREKIAA